VERVAAARARSVGDDAARPIAVPPDRVKRTRKGDYLLRLTANEREALRSTVGLLRQLLTEGDMREDPALRRLFPPAYMDDPERSAEFDGMVRDELLSGRLAAIQTVEETLDAPRVSEEQLTAWLSAINDIRLVLGVRLAVTEESTPSDFEGDAERSQSYALYGYLTWLEDDVIGSLSSAR
jgi:Domain of unknown function (DUF2017)